MFRLTLILGAIVLSLIPVHAGEVDRLPLPAKQLKQRFLADLQRLQEQSTRAGKLEEALAIKQEIERIQGSSARPPFLGKWAAPNGPIDIMPDKTARHGGDTASWEVTDGELILTWSNGYKHRYPATFAGDTLRGKEISPSGSAGLIIITRMRE